MNTNTGEIVSFAPGQPIPADHVPLGNYPVPTCKDCNGKGHSEKIIRQGRKFVYRPCHCTNPK